MNQDPFFDPSNLLNFNDGPGFKQLIQPSTTTCSQLPDHNHPTIHQQNQLTASQKLLEHKDRIIDLQDRVQKLTDKEHKQEIEINNLKGQLANATNQIGKLFSQSTKVDQEVEQDIKISHQNQVTTRCADSQTDSKFVKCPVTTCELALVANEIGFRVLRSHIVDKSGCEAHQDYRCKKCQWVMFSPSELLHHRQYKDCIKELGKHDSDYLNNWQKKKASKYIEEKRGKKTRRKNIFKTTKISVTKTKEMIAAIYINKGSCHFQVCSENEEKTEDAEKNEECLSEQVCNQDDEKMSDEEDYRLDHEDKNVIICDGFC